MRNREFFLAELQTRSEAFYLGPLGTLALSSFMLCWPHHRCSLTSLVDAKSADRRLGASPACRSISASPASAVFHGLLLPDGARRSKLVELKSQCTDALANVYRSVDSLHLLGCARFCRS